MKHTLFLTLIIGISSCTLDLTTDPVYYNIPDNKRFVLSSKDTAIYVSSESGFDTFIVNSNSYYDDSDKKTFVEFVINSYVMNDGKGYFRSWQFPSDDKFTVSSVSYYFDKYQFSLDYPTEQLKPDTILIVGDNQFSNICFFYPKDLELKYYDSAPSEIVYSETGGLLKYSYPDSSYYELYEVKAFNGN